MKSVPLILRLVAGLFTVALFSSPANGQTSTNTTRRISQFPGTPPPSQPNSAVGVSDGNPNAATARSADLAFNSYSFAPTMTATEQSNLGQEKSSAVAVGLVADGGTFSSQGFQGHTMNWTPIIPISLGQDSRVRLEVAIPISYVEVKGFKEYGLGLQIAVPIMIVKRATDQPWLWQLTPVGGTSGTRSSDVSAGGGLAMGGLSSLLSYLWNHWEFSLGNSVMCYEDYSLDFGGSETYDDPVSQQIFKNGLKIGRQIGDNWYAEAYFIDTEFAHSAFTPRYSTVGGAVGWRGAGGKGYLMLGAYTDLAPGYTSAKFQFGTGWKF